MNEIPDDIAEALVNEVEEQMTRGVPAWKMSGHGYKREDMLIREAAECIAVILSRRAVAP